MRSVFSWNQKFTKLVWPQVLRLEMSWLFHWHPVLLLGGEGMVTMDEYKRSLEAKFSPKCMSCFALDYKFVLFFKGEEIERSVSRQGKRTPDLEIFVAKDCGAACVMTAIQAKFCILPQFRHPPSLLKSQCRLLWFIRRRTTSKAWFRQGSFASSNCLAHANTFDEFSQKWRKAVLEISHNDGSFHPKGNASNSSQCGLARKAVPHKHQLSSMSILSHLGQQLLYRFKRVFLHCSFDALPGI